MVRGSLLKSLALDATMADVTGARSTAIEQIFALRLSHLRAKLGKLNPELQKGDLGFHCNILGVD